MEMKIELIPIPVTNVDRARDFYVKIGFSLDHDHVVNENLRFVQLTPPGSGCSICLGVGLTTMKPGSVESYQMVVKDVRAVREELAAKGVEISEVTVLEWGDFAYFSDPDGNKWALQQLPAR